MAAIARKHREMEGRRLREASDRLLRDLDVLATLEEEKRTTPPADPRFQQLAMRIEEIASRIFASSSQQTDLGRSIAAEDTHGLSTIEGTRRPVAAVLDEWRAAERMLVAAEPGSVDESEAKALAKRLRAEYQEAVNRQRS